MSTLQQAYDSVFTKEAGYRSAWPPLSSTADIGWIGAWESTGFQPLEQITTLFPGLDLASTQAGDPGGQVDFTYGKFKQQNYTISGSVRTPVGEFPETNVTAEIDYSFESSEAFIVRYSDIITYQITVDPLVLAGQIMTRIKNRNVNWNYSWAIIYRKYVASSYGLFISQSKNSSLTLGGTASVLGAFTSGSIAGSVQISNQVNMSYAQTGYEATPGIIGFDAFCLSEHSKGQVYIPCGGQRFTPPTVNG